MQPKQYPYGKTRKTKNGFFWQHYNFTISLRNPIYISEGRYTLSYTLHEDSTLVFSDKDFSPPPMCGHDYFSLHSVMCLLGFLTLKPGDTDDEYFEKYTPEQLAWTKSIQCEDLSMLQYDYEEDKTL